MLDLFNVGIVKEYTNCVSWATLDPFACLFRRALSREHVVPIVEEIKGVT